VTFLGAIVALKEHGHPGTDRLVGRLGNPGKKLCLVTGQLLMLYATWLLFSHATDRRIC
jgi:TRAP-type C4-dicarboxylate transport system permease small subunit